MLTSMILRYKFDLYIMHIDSEGHKEESASKKSGVLLRGNSSDDDLWNDGLDTAENDLKESTSQKNDLKKQENVAALELSNSNYSHSFSGKLINLQIPSKDDLLQKLNNEYEAAKSISKSSLESPSDGYETAEELFSLEEDQMDLDHNPSVEELEQREEEIIPDESITQRLNSHKDLKLYQLGKQLSCKWSTGAGSLIGCLRDYPSQLQSHALEQVNLSPKTTCRLKMSFTSRASTPTSLSRVMQMSCSLSPMGNMTLSCLSRRYSSPPQEGP